MPTNKELEDRIRAFDMRLSDVGIQVENLEGQITTLGQTLYDDAHTVPQWGLDMVEALIEALHGVRLQGAQQYAIKLQERYFPEDGEESSSTDPVESTNEDIKLWG